MVIATMHCINPKGIFYLEGDLSTQYTIVVFASNAASFGTLRHDPKFGDSSGYVITVILLQASSIPYTI